jgi:uroporphyrinogen III methyltransferase/synthase
MSHTTGKVFLVGAGPGDPGLITVRGKECLERAHVVIYDSLINEALLAHAPNAEHIFAGKATAKHTLMQDEINTLLVDWAKKVERVVRLKGGDPFVFGRGGEEALYLAERGIPFEIVPGVTAGIAVPAYAGIPVTHRGMASSVVLLAGHLDPASGEGAVALEELPGDGTLVFYMAVKQLPKIAIELIERGRAASTPCAVITRGTCAAQQTVSGTLDTIAHRAFAEQIGPPAVFVVGEVASLSGKLSWFESRPLFGKRIVITRARDHAGELARQLQELGADIFEFPTIKIEPVANAVPIDHVGKYDWIVFTSVNGVEMLFERLDESGRDARDFSGVKLCVIGSATRDAVKKRFLNPDLMPDKYDAEHVLDALVACSGDLAGKRFLLPRADIARSFLPKELRNRGAEVTELVAYRTVLPETPEELADALVAYEPHLITFTSSSTARNFGLIAGQQRLEKIRSAAEFASIGPLTSETAQELGLHVTVQPEQHDIPHLVKAIVDWSQKQ